MIDPISLIFREGLGNGGDDFAGAVEVAAVGLFYDQPAETASGPRDVAPLGGQGTGHLGKH